jgi:arginyl-tRNA synthetase
MACFEYETDLSIPVYVMKIFVQKYKNAWQQVVSLSTPSWQQIMSAVHLHATNWLSSNQFVVQQIMQQVVNRQINLMEIGL